MAALVTEPSLRLLVQNINPDSLNTFDPKVIAQHQSQVALLVNSLLRAAAGLSSTYNKTGPIPDIQHKVIELEDPRDLQPRNKSATSRDQGLIATVTLYMLSYARNQHSNIFQMTAGNWAFADNATKRMTKILHCMRILVTYQTIWEALWANAEAQRAVLQEKVWHKRFFVSYDNMNFYYKHRDQHVHNKPHQVAYTAGYICFMRSESDNTVDANWEHTYLNAD